MMVRLPERDRLSLTRARCRADISVAMGGRVAEELIFGADTVTSSAAADIRTATDLARAMVTRFGMSQRLGPLAYGADDGEVFAGQAVTRRQQMSGLTQTLVDEEIKRLIAEGEQTARGILAGRLDDLHRAAEALREYETLTGEQLRRLLAGKPVDAPQTSTPAPAVQSG
jgi:cell division protease FtsH